jgi:hypothetical protein
MGPRAIKGDEPKHARSRRVQTRPTPLVDRVVRVSAETVAIVEGLPSAT